MSSVSRLAVGLVVLSAVAQCFDPTEIVVDIETNAACTTVQANKVAISIGAPGSDDAGITTVTGACADGSVGSLVLTPTNVNLPVGIRVMLGIEGGVEGCAAPDYAGCVVARRALLYSPHTPLHLPIDLDEACVNVACDPSSTCFHGGCVDASVPCTGGTCDLPDAGACVDTGPVTIATLATGTKAHSPRIAKASKGYFVAWEPMVGVLHGMTVDVTGTTVPGLGEIPLATSPIDTFGPVGSDGYNYAVSYATAKGLAVDLLTPLGTMMGATIGPTLNATTPLAGMYRGPSDYVMAAQANQTLLLLFPSSTGGFTDLLSGGTSPTRGTFITLARNGPGLYYVGLVASTDAGTGCEVWSCDKAGVGSFTCAPANLAQSPGCQMVRVGTEGQHWYAATAHANLVTGYLDGMPIGAGTFQLDDPLAFMVLTTPAALQFRVVARVGGNVVTAIFPTGKTPVVISTTPTGYPPAFGVGFDAVEDAPFAEGYAVVWFDAMTSTIQFAHRCAK
jgi:hypothetical protein